MPSFLSAFSCFSIKKHHAVPTFSKDHLDTPLIGEKEDGWAVQKWPQQSNISSRDTNNAKPCPVYRKTLFPVFVTADISLDKINALLQRSADRLAALNLQDTMGLFLVHDAHMPKPHQISGLPVSTFSSPFLGKSLAQLIPIFMHSVRGEPESDDIVSATQFIVIDTRTMQEDLLLLASVNFAGLVGEEGQELVERYKREKWDGWEAIDGDEVWGLVVARSEPEIVCEVLGDEAVMDETKSWVNEVGNDTCFGTAWGKDSLWTFRKDKFIRKKGMTYRQEDLLI